MKSSTKIIGFTILGAVIGALLGLLSVGFLAFQGASADDWVRNGMVGGIAGGLFCFTVAFTIKVTKNKTNFTKWISVLLACILGSVVSIFFAHFLTSIVLSLWYEYIRWR